MTEVARVVIVFECGTADITALRAIRPLAGDGAPRVMGLFIEDEALYGAAALPGVVEVSLTSLKAERLDPLRIQQDLERQAREVRARFEESAKTLRLHHSFKIIRGEPADMLSDVAGRSDFVVLCRPLRGPGLRPRRRIQLGNLMLRHRELMFVNEPWETGSRVVVVAGGNNPVSAHAIEKAADVAAAEGLELVIASTEGACTALQEEGTEGRCVELAEISEESVIALCLQEDARLLVADTDETLDWQTLLDGLLDRLSCSLLIVNSQTG